MKAYIAFSIHGTNTFITANKELENLTPEFSIIQSRNPDANRSYTKLLWNKLITKKGIPLRSPAMILHHFNQLEKEGWTVNKQGFINYHYKR